MIPMNDMNDYEATQRKWVKLESRSMQNYFEHPIYISWYVLIIVEGNIARRDTSVRVAIL